MPFVTHIWTQLGLSYTIKQIYDKHKVIWWDRVNVRETMMGDGFIRQQDITYLDGKHKRGSWHLQKLGHFHGHLIIWMMLFISNMWMKLIELKSHLQ